jgi:carboxymethylenebutenolidase
MKTDEMEEGALTRRDFAATLAVGAVSAVAVSSAAAQPAGIIETDVMIKTPDGMCQAAFIHPTTGAHPGVIIWPDAFGLRPVMRDFGRRVAAEGYSVLVPNPFYRVTNQTPVVQDTLHFNFGNQADMAKLTPLMSSIGGPGAAEKDAVAFVAFLDSQPQVDKGKKIGTQGYCMGGPLTMRTAAAVPNRIGAGGSFHGGGLVTDAPTSPHLMVPKIKAKFYFGIASNDDMRQPDAKDKLKAAFAAAGNPAEIEVYKERLHGWTVPDMPVQPMPIYDMSDAERAWKKLFALYKTSLA